MTQFTIRCHHRFQPTPPPVDARAWDSSHHSPPTRLTRVLIIAGTKREHEMTPTRLTRVLRSRSRQARKPPRRQRAPPRARRGARPRRRRGALRCELAFAQRRSASRERRATVRRRRCTASRRRAPSQAGPLGRTSGSPRPRPRGPCAVGSRAAGAVPVPERKPGMGRPRPGWAPARPGASAWETPLAWPGNRRNGRVSRPSARSTRGPWSRWRRRQGAGGPADTPGRSARPA